MFESEAKPSKELTKLASAGSSYALLPKHGARWVAVSDLHVPSHPVLFKPFRFGKDLKTFKMAYAFAAKTEAPKQASHIALSGREVSRTCVAAPSCK